MRRMTMNHVENLKNIFFSGVKAAQPSSIFQKNENLVKEINTAVDLNYDCHVVGFGKAVLGMAVQLEKILGKRLISGILSLPHGTISQFTNVPEMNLSNNSVIDVHEGALNNLPDYDALETAQKIKSLAESLNEKNILFILISGGGSALLPLPKPQITFEEKLEIISKLAHRGANIKEMNAVRITLSDIKGGKLARMARNSSKIISLIISDIVNDPVELIASGPTINSAIEMKMNPVEILQKYLMWDEIKESTQTVIAEDKFIDCKLDSNRNIVHIIGNNTIAVNACKETAKEYKYEPFILSTEIEGNIASITRTYEDFLRTLKKYRNGTISKHEFHMEFPFKDDIFSEFVKLVDLTSKPLLLILAGETTAEVTGNGSGGRNQELAMRISWEFHDNLELSDITFLSAGTDGIDGPTIAAGAIGHRSVIDHFYENNLKSNYIEYLENNDSFKFYKNIENGKFLVITGHTGTNVMDLHLIVMP